MVGVVGRPFGCVYPVYFPVWGRGHTRDPAREGIRVDPQPLCIRVSGAPGSQVNLCFDSRADVGRRHVLRTGRPEWLSTPGVWHAVKRCANSAHVSVQASKGYPLHPMKQRSSCSVSFEFISRVVVLAVVCHTMLPCVVLQTIPKSAVVFPTCVGQTCLCRDAQQYL